MENLASRDYSEKRDFIRMRTDTPANIEVLDGGSIIAGVCKDLSGGGMLLHAESPLPLNCQVKITIQTHHGHNPILIAHARVARVQSNPNGSCTLGIEILELQN